MWLIPHSRAGALWRFALAAFVVIACVAATTAVAGLLQFKQFATYLSATPALKNAQVVIPNPGEPQTILIIGSDHRAGTSFGSSNTDTMMLVRLDPSSSTINVMSIPRDLKVQIPEAGGLATSKLNSAYSIGGPNLLESVIKKNVFPGLKINHIVDVNFGGFQDLVNAIGCVYTDVDHRYYNNTAQTGYSSIDLNAGYQKLCGPDALSFVRFRHTDSDIVRNARQQDFIRWAKDQYGVTALVSNRDTLLKIFGKHTQTDRSLHTTDGLINLFNLVAFSAGHTIKQLAFPAILLPCPVTATGQTPCYVSADPSAEANVYSKFMTPTIAPATAAAPVVAAKRHRSPSAQALGLAADPADGKSQAKALGNAGLTVYYPKLIDSSSQYCMDVTANCYEPPNPTTVYVGAYPRAYVLHDPSGQPHAAYRLTLVVNSALGEYYGVQGTTWRTPPILKTPQQTRIVHGKKLLVYLNGHHITLVAWRTPQAAYWISNTLNDAISNGAMLAMAGSLTKAGP
ncbi:MAG: polyisoprenyl-teichoic acid--peptidoglycan teichoic acid transferase [Solirubrobacteraceae bacterium]|jgi:LCP family protein required for cell wall assembly|nr:polyisoprenyl-teichoic acid--peptidoglycan teichoic acid transferase [Solirubrobacteraceae bacterium]